MAPIVVNPKLRLDRLANAEVLITVDYEVLFFPAERNRTEFFVSFNEIIEVIGVDPAGSETGTVLIRTNRRPLSKVTPGDSILKLPEHVEIKAKRTVLDEDGNPFVHPDTIPDQIRCRIIIETRDPIAGQANKFTNQVILGGDIIDKAMANVIYDFNNP